MFGSRPSAQIALAWLLARKPRIVPIPGTTNRHRFEENLGAASLERSADAFDAMRTTLDGVATQGDRHPPRLAERVGR